MFFRRRQVLTLSSVHEGVLGTQLRLQARSDRRSTLNEAERLVLAEIDRLESVFSVYRPDSELNRWKLAGGAVAPSPELSILLGLGREWHRRSNGVFNPCVGVLSERWKVAAAVGKIPEPDELAALAATIANLPYAEIDGQFVRHGDCSSLNFNALAKGLLIDITARHVAGEVDLRSLVINIGGDLVHLGEGASAVRIENPARPFDNSPPLQTVYLSDAGLATSGLTKRGVTIGGRWFSHVIDPRSGWPVDAVRSASVIAADAATADVIATLVSVLPPAEGMAQANALAEHPGCLIVGADGSVTTNSIWDSHCAA